MRRRTRLRSTSLGVRAGDRVTVQLEKSIEGVWLYLAVLRCGAIYMPLNSGYTDAEIEYFVTDAEPTLVVVEASRRAAVAALAEKVGVAARVTTLDELDERSRSVAPVPSVSCADGDVAAILYTSGTTGRSKGAMISHRNLTSNAKTLVDIWGFTPDDVLVHALPIYHVHGLFVALHCALAVGRNYPIPAALRNRQRARRSRRCDARSWVCRRTTHVCSARRSFREPACRCGYGYPAPRRCCPRRLPPSSAAPGLRSWSGTE